MPEIKKTFTAGKMNKDLDERLVPNGEYRDALNVQVRTTDGESAGVLQNIQGNALIASSVNQLDWSGAVTSKTIGSVADEKNNKAYFFISGTDYRKLLESPADIDAVKHCYDTIIEVSTRDAISPNTSAPVVVDHYATVLPKSSLVPAQFQVSIRFQTLEVNTELQIRPGARLIAYASDGSNSQRFDTKIIDFAKATEGYTRIVLEDIQGPIDWSEINHFLILNERVLNFDKNKLITGVNVIDKFLIWTDGQSEPKKINIDRCKEGTPNIKTHTQLKLNAPLDNDEIVDYVDSGDGVTSFMEDPLSPLINNNLKEAHATVIKKAPRIAPNLIMKDSAREGETTAYGVDFDFFGVADAAGNELENGLTMTITDTANFTGEDAPNWFVNDILVFREELIDFDSRATIKATIDSYNTSTGELIITLISIGTVLTPQNEISGSGIWTIELQEADPLFELKLCRFGCRYKYNDGEYSTYSPWSEIAFLPGKLDYNHKKGYNLGMVNNLRQLTITDFIPHQTTREGDAVAVDILYKTTDSPNVYIVKTITRGMDPEWDLFTTTDDNPKLVYGKLEITSEMIHKSVDKDQLLRAWDNVPRYALAQEIAANRLMFGNYVQGYDVGSSVGLIQSIKSDDVATIIDPSKSVKTLRTYKWGMVFGDKYGRETPVISGGYLNTEDSSGDNSTFVDGGTFLDKQFAPLRNRFELTQVWTNSNDAPGIPDQWMEYVKYYVKETSNEYYNLIMDRWYYAEDGNIWISFASADRNKLDLETYLYLKKEHGNDNAVLEKARYKVIAIENEAPDFIKIDPRIMGRVEIMSGVEYEYMFSPATGVNTGTTSPVLLMNGTTMIVNFDTWGGFLQNHNQRGDYQVRIVGINSNGDELHSRIWRTVTYNGMDTAGNGVLRWNKSFGEEADMVDRFNNQGLDPDGLTYWLEFREMIVVNEQPEFDGKFFVKIEKDEVLESKVLMFNPEAADFDNIGTYPVAYIDSQANHPSVGNSAITDTNPTGAELHPYATGATGASADFKWMDLAPVAQSASDVYNSNGGAVATVTTCDWRATQSDSFSDSNPQYPTFAQGGDFIALGCDEDFPANNEGYAYMTDYDGDMTLVNWSLPTREYFEWLGVTVLPALQSGIFIDSCRVKLGTFSPGGGNGVTQQGINNNDGDAYRSPKNYKPTGLDEGYQSGDNFGPTEDGEFGRIFLSAHSIDRKGGAGYPLSNGQMWKGFSEGYGAEFYQHMTQPGNYFRFNDDPNGNVYQIVGSYHEMKKPEGLDPWIGGSYQKGMHNFGALNSFYEEDFDDFVFPATWSYQQNACCMDYGYWGDEDWATSSTSWGQTTSGNQNQLSQAGYGPTLENIVWGGDDYGNSSLSSNFGGGADDDGLNGDGPRCYECRGDFKDEDEFKWDFCRREGFRVEFRKVDTATGSLAVGPISGNAGCKGMDITEWDPRGIIPHDGRKALLFNLVGKNISGGEKAIPVENAAIWETEPKEDVGLDIWFEASNAIPMNLDRHNSHNYIPLNCKISALNANKEPYPLGQASDPYTVLGLESTATDYRVCHVSHMQGGTVVGIRAQSVFAGVETLQGGLVRRSGELYIGDHIVFHHDDGTKTMSEILAYVTPGLVDYDDENSTIIQAFADPFPNQETTEWATPDPLINTYETVFYQAQGSTSDGEEEDNGRTGYYKVKNKVWEYPIELAWFNCWVWGNGLESNRIRDDFNAVMLDNGVKANSTFLNYGEEEKSSSIIYSGIYNSISGVNNLNEFNMGEKITKDLNPSYGKIQALKTRDTDIVSLTEDKILRITTNKDALYNADGNPQLIASNRVLGTAVPYVGDYGISKNPESMAWDQNRLYFTDARRGAVLRLSDNGLTPISNIGMKEWFRDYLKISNTVIGSFDTISGEYNATIFYGPRYETVSFSEHSKGWVSFKSFIPESGLSVNGTYLTAVENNVWEHHRDKDEDNDVIPYNTFYDEDYPTSVTFLFNEMPGSVKSFKNINYEGSQARVDTITDGAQLNPTQPDGTSFTLPYNDFNSFGDSSGGDGEYYNLTNDFGWYVQSCETDLNRGDAKRFIKKEGKWFAYVKGTQRVIMADTDISDFSVQGLGISTAEPIVVEDENIEVVIPDNEDVAGDSSDTGSGTTDTDNDSGSDGDSYDVVVEDDEEDIIVVPDPESYNIQITGDGINDDTD